MVLYGVTGKALELAIETWRQLLAVASSRGWTPGGTAALPRTIFPGQPEPSPWTGAYDQPFGQEVSRKDATALAESLMGTPDSRETHNILPLLGDFLELCRHGGFVICDGTAATVTPDSIREAQFTTSLVNLTNNLGVSLHPGQASPSTSKIIANKAPHQ